MESTSERTLGSVETAFEIIDVLVDHGPLGVTEISNRMDLSKSSAYIHLRTLRELGYVVRDGTDYDVGLRFLETGGASRRRRPVYQAARREVDRLALDVEEAAHLGVEEDGKRIILYKSEVGEAIYDNTPTGESTHMHWTAIGKMLLAHMSADRVDEIVDSHGLPRSTEATITERDELHRRLDLIRERGYAVENEERREGVVAVAVPIFDTNTDRNVAAISISGPRERVTNTGDDGIKSDLLDALRNRANIAELRYNHY